MMSHILAGGLAVNTSPFLWTLEAVLPKDKQQERCTKVGGGIKYLCKFRMSCFFPAAGLLFGYSAAQKSHPLVSLPAAMFKWIVFFLL